MIWNTSELSASHLSRATANFVVDGCQFGHNWILGWKWSLWSVARLRCNADKFQVDLYEVLPNFLHHTSAVPQPFILLIAANLGLAWFLGWKWSLWPVPAWLEVQRSKAVFFLTLHGHINDMKHVWTVCITPQPCHSHFYCWWLPIWP